MVRIAALLTLVLLGAGCLSSPSEPPASDAAAAPAAQAFLFEADTCDEGGGYVTWNMKEPNQIPPPFAGENVRDDLGDPPFNGGGTQGPVADENITGAYHATIWCPTYRIQGEERQNLLIAIVGGRVLPPPFDPAPVARNYQLSTIGINDPDLHALFEARGLPVDPLLGATLSFDNDVLVQTMSYAIHGDIISAVPVKAYREKPDETIRIWMMAKQADDTMVPVALDFVDVGGSHLIASQVGHFDHRTPPLAPGMPTGVPLHEFPSWALAYRGVARTAQWGPAIEQTFDGSGHGH